LDRSVFGFVTVHLFERQADGRTDRQNSHHWTASTLQAAR